MAKFWIIKTGSTFPALAASLGDFDAWVCHQLELLPEQVGVCHVQAGDTLPPAHACLGALLTGSHAMVTEHEPWSERCALWLADAVAQQLPVLGICYGHQLLAHACGGRVDYHPRGREIGTVPIYPSAAAHDDALLAGLPSPFLAHVTHAQSVLQLPANATLLASSDYEACHAFRVGKHAWGVQFHPEFSQEAMRGYIEMQAEKLKHQGLDVEQLLQNVRATDHSHVVLRRFRDYCLQHSA